MKKILIYGWFGENNFGDELLLKSMCNLIRSISSSAIVNVVGSKPKEIRKNHKGVHRVSHAIYMHPRKIVSAMIKDPINTVMNIIDNDVLIVAGGGAISDWNKSSTKEMFFLMNVFSAMKKPIYLLGVGAGPISNQKSYEPFRKVLSKAEAITTRDNYSYNELYKIGLTNVILGKDLAYYSKLDCEKCAFPDSIKNIGLVLAPVCMNSREVYESFIEETRKLITTLQTSYNVSLIPFQYKYDKVLLDRLVDGLTDVTVLYDSQDIWMIEEYIKSQDLIIGMRYHSLIIATLFRKFVIPIVYHPKDWSFCVDFDLLRYSESIGNGENWRNSNISSEHICQKIDGILGDDNYVKHVMQELENKKSISVERDLIINILEGLTN